MLTGASATCGDFTRSEAAGVRPVSANSSTSGVHSPEVSTIRAWSTSSTMLMTKSPVSRMFRNVSLGCPPRSLIETASSGGRLEIALKNENGARL